MILLLGYSLCAGVLAFKMCHKLSRVEALGSAFYSVCEENLGCDTRQTWLKAGECDMLCVLCDQEGMAPYL